VNIEGRKNATSPHLLLYVIERVWGVDREANKNDVGVRIAEGSKTIVIFLPGGIP
jgi:hypothetical protein